MLQAIRQFDTETATPAPRPTPPPTPPLTVPIKNILTTAEPVRATVTALQPSALTTKAPTTMVVATLPYTCANGICSSSGPLAFTFQLLQSMINMANKRLGNTAIAVDGKLDARTLNAYLPISRAVGGTLAIFDFTPTPDYLAQNAETFARTIAQWLGITWVPEQNGTPGHWERLRAGQTTVNLPPIPTTTSVFTPMPETATPPPPPPMIMYVCPDGTRVSDMKACPVPQAQPYKPTCVPPPSPSPGSQVPATYWDEYHACLRAAGLPVPAQIPPSLPPAPGTPPPGGNTGVVPPQITPPPGVTPLPTPVPEPIVTPGPGRYQGCLARFNRTRKVYSIYCRAGSTGAQPGLGTIDQEYFRCLRDNCTGLGEDTVTPPPPSGYVKAAEVTTLPGAGETSAGEERDKFFRLGNPLMWAAIAGAATVVGGGSYMLYRRKHRSA